MTEKDLAVILGATRGQGASVVNALLESGRYRIRGLTTDPASSGILHLEEQGVEVNIVDLDNPSSLTAAFASANVIFAVTTMYDGDMEREVAQGKNIANAAVSLNSLIQFVWSTLPSASYVSDGRIPVPHMDGKALVDEYIYTSLPGLVLKTTFYWGGFYAENVTYPQFRSSLLPSAGKRVWVQPVGPQTLVPMVGDHNVNTGIIVRRILESGPCSVAQRYVFGVVDWVTHGELLASWAAIEGRNDEPSPDLVYIKSDIDTVDHLWPGVGGELGQMLRLCENLGTAAWRKKKGAPVVTLQDLNLTIGEGEGRLVSTEKALQKLAAKLALGD